MAELTLILGSTSDWEKNPRANIKGQLEEVTGRYNDLTVNVRFASAHNTPDLVQKVVNQATGIERLWTSGAGMSAALPGVMEAVYTGPLEPNVGIPISDERWLGLSAFLSISEMPPNNPVLCPGIDNVVAGMTIAYNLEREPKKIALVRFSSDTEGYEKMKGKFASVLGEDVMKDESKVVDLGELRYVWCGENGDKLPEELNGSLIVTYASTCNLKDIGAFSEIDRIAAETGGAHISLNNGKHVRPDDAYRYATQFSHCKATGTMALGSVGYTNAAQFAARVMGMQEAIERIKKTKKGKAETLESDPGYIVQTGQAKKAA